MRLFHCDHAAIRPRALRDGVQRSRQVGGTHIQVLAAGSDRPQHVPNAQARGIGIGNHNVQRHHGTLNRQVRVLPDRQRVDRKVTALCRQRNLLQIMPNTVRLATQFRSGTRGGGDRGARVAGRQAKGQEEEDWGTDTHILKDKSGTRGSRPEKDSFSDENSWALVEKRRDSLVLVCCDTQASEDASFKGKRFVQRQVRSPTHCFETCRDR